VQPRIVRPLVAALSPLLIIPLSSADAGTAPWQEILHLQDGRYNNAARMAENVPDGTMCLAYKAQVGTDSNTRQIAAGTWDSDTWSFGDVTANTSSKEYPDVAVTYNGVTHLVWRESVGGGVWQVFYANDAGGSWSASRQITHDTPVKGSPTIAADPGLTIGADTVFVHVAYSTLETGTADDEIYYLRYDTLADTSEVVQITSDSVTDDDVSIRVDADGNVHLAWISGGFEGAVRYAVGDVNGFTDVPTGVVAGAAKADLGLDWSGVAHICYRHSVSGSVKVIRHIRRSGAGFTSPLDASASDAFYTEPSMAATNTPAIAFVSNTAGKKGLYVAAWDAGSSGFAPPDTVHADPNVTYNETDLVPLCCKVGLPGGRSFGAAGIVVTSTGYVDADTVRADLHAFLGAIATPTGAPLVPAAASLGLAARPNPFEDATTIEFTLREASSRVRLDVLDVAGRRVASLLEAPRPAGSHRVRWSPEGVPAGVYFLRLEADGSVEGRTLLHLR